MEKYSENKVGLLKIGERIKKLRKEKGLTIKELAKKTGISEGFISKAERCINSPSLTTLQKIANILEVPINYFFLSNSNEVRIVRKNGGTFIQDADCFVKHKVLSSRLPNGTVLLAQLLPGEKTRKNEFIHEGFECSFVVKGKVNWYIEGVKYVLNTGESINFNSGLYHGFENIGEETAIILSCNIFFR